jgi:hypothetical protein
MVHYYIASTLLANLVPDIHGRIYRCRNIQVLRTFLNKPVAMSTKLKLPPITKKIVGWTLWQRVKSSPLVLRHHLCSSYTQS